MYKNRRAFTLIEILVVMGMITILSSVVLIAVNPLRQFAQARNSQRVSNVNAILNAIGNRVAENRGLFTDADTCPTALPNVSTSISKSGYDLRPCLVPIYLSELPFDPSVGRNSCTSPTCAGSGEIYDTHYTINQNDETGRITICAPGAAETAIAGSEAYCLTR